MPAKATINIGDKFWRLTVLKELPPIKKKSKGVDRIFEMMCDCGKVKNYYLSNFKSGHTKSCGCLNSEMVIHRNITEKRYGGLGSRTHGESSNNITAEYRTWIGMRNRCKGKRDMEAKHYLDKGIVVCDRWLNSFENFLSDMGRRPTGKHSIDRINSKGNYEPSNCRWATQKEQQNNKSSNRIIEHLGWSKNVAQWSEFYNTQYKPFYKKLKSCKWNLDTYNIRFHEEFLYSKELV